MADSLLHSPLHAAHLSLGGRMVPFAGWEMPVQYAGIIDEHRAVRSGCGVFDISHMGQLFITGDGAAAWLDRMLSGHISAMSQGSALYGFMLNERGGVIDDLITYRLDGDQFLLIVNAALASEDLAWLEDHRQGGVEIDDRSAAHAAIAIQGPASAEVAAAILGGAAMPKRNAVQIIDSPEGAVYLCGTGYTGEAGFELVCPAEAGPRWFAAALEAGCTPCGLGSRDSLRLEMGYPLNGSDLSPERTPLEAGLGFFVALDKPDFIGRKALLEQKEAGLAVKLAGVRMGSKGPPPRPGYDLWAGGERVGSLCSGGLSPCLGVGIGMAYLPPGLCGIDTPLEVDIRGRRHAAVVARKPFYRPTK